jgi:hypothetical protein
MMDEKIRKIQKGVDKKFGQLIKEDVKHDRDISKAKKVLKKRGQHGRSGR